MELNEIDIYTLYFVTITIMEIISVDFYKTYRVSLFGKAILLLSCKSTPYERK